MRTRRSNRTKSFKVEKYDFGFSSDEEDVEQPRRAHIAEERDQTFDAPNDDDAASEHNPADDGSEPVASAGEDYEDDAAGSDAEDGAPATSRRRASAPKTKRAQAQPGESSEYVPLEQVTTDAAPKTYTGRNQRYARKDGLMRLWYGPDVDTIRNAVDMTQWYLRWTLLPPKVKTAMRMPWERGMCPGDFFVREEAYVEPWLERIADNGTVLWPLSDAEASPYKLSPGKLPVLVGPYDSQSEITVAAGNTLSISESGLPYEQDENPDKIPSGWMFDVGGIVTSLDWAKGQKSATQILALAVIPHTDQELSQDLPNMEGNVAMPETPRHGMVQIWECSGEESVAGFLRPSTQSPKIQKTLCLDYGRATIVKWSPCCRHLAILCGDGAVYIVEPGLEATAPFEKVTRPLASFRITDEWEISSKAMTWVNFNRLAIGYSDGSIGLWSIRPQQLLSRHIVHHSPIIDMASGYPSFPYLVASTPWGGFAKLIDLRSPSQQSSETPTLSINTTPNAMGYSDHLRGFFSIAPSSSIVNTTVAFMHHAYFPIPRKTFTGGSLPTCLSVGRTHPCLLVGGIDASLRALNPQPELILSRREVTQHIRIFQHEHRTSTLFPPGSPAAERGASRIVQGFLPEDNNHSKVDTKPVPVTSKAAKPKKRAAARSEDEPAEEEAEASDATGIMGHEPLSRVTCVEWNPNEGYGCWAAVSMASGLVKIIDLGLETDDDYETSLIGY